MEIDLLLTTLNKHHNRVSMHGLHRKVLEVQAEAIGIPLNIIEVPEKPSMEEYNSLMMGKIEWLKSKGYTQTVFGDIFLEDLKRYREQMLLPYGIKAIFPLWKIDTKQLIHEFIDVGFKAIIICIDTLKLDMSFLGKELSLELIDRLPKDVDPCGENGEFHTFCFDGPIFKNPVPFEIGEKVFRDYDNPLDKKNSITFGFCDIKLKD
ncbi:hypothetical protein HME9304_01881 [Flagellimonas maritima]|uniref:Diphthamide synthase domain-containing protein n=1 Tax=Flagellimonas maritima TaxID=1383885 RepID=A0A2Z4LSW1_9FLAO|nr:hypothetical protein HME9304_01881 [Allomuricauda aurantiaca]